jgi:hypothetical protein
VRRCRIVVSHHRSHALSQPHSSGDCRHQLSIESAAHPQHDARHPPSIDAAAAECLLQRRSSDVGRLRSAHG